MWAQIAFDAAMAEHQEIVWTAVGAAAGPPQSPAWLKAAEYAWNAAVWSELTWPIAVLTEAIADAITC